MAGSTRQLLALLSLLLSFSCSANAGNEPSVIIIGAGISGIMAAKTLSENGVKEFLILEARSIIGGRMREEPFAGGVVEMGANWVEGVNGPEVNPIWTLAKKYKLRTFLTNFSNQSSNVYNENGFVDPAIVKKDADIADAEKDYVTELAKSKTKNKEQDISILTGQRLFGTVPVTPIQMCLEYQNYDFEYAEPPRVTSLKNTHPNPTFEVFGDDEYFVADKRGYSLIVFELAKEILKSKDGKINDPRLLLNKVVRKIEYSKSGVKLSIEDGTTYTSKKAIVTVPLGVLQSDLIKFSPPLPSWKVEALFEFNMAIYTKIFLRFPYTFWPTDSGAQFMIYCDERRGYYSTWQHLANEFPGKHLIFVTVTDEESRRIEQLSDDEIKAEVKEVLKKMFKIKIPDVEEIFVPRWGHERFFKGSYSNWPIGVTEYEFKAIQAPVNNILYFAGEHTSQDYGGYVHGAYFTGIDAAHELLNCIKKKKCNGFVPDKHRSRNSGIPPACLVDVLKEREATRQAWSKRLDAMMASFSNSTV